MNEGTPVTNGTTDPRRVVLWVVVALMAAVGLALAAYGFLPRFVTVETAVPGAERRIETAVPTTERELVLPPTEYDPDLPKPGTEQTFCGIEMVWIPPGSFVMGSPETEPERGPGEVQHVVTLTDGFWISKYEVTNAQFRDFVEETGYESVAEKQGFGKIAGNKEFRTKKGVTWRSPGWEIQDNHPVTVVSLKDAVAYCDWLSGKGQGTFRILTEAEWEYACRAGTTTTFPWGDDPADGKGWCNGADLSAKRVLPEHIVTFDWDDGYESIAPVGQFRPNAWGVYDMQGNVAEWCQDYFAWPYPKEHVTNPRGPAGGDLRIRRGGCWAIDWHVCRSAARSQGFADGASNLYGIRVCREASSEVSTEQDKLG